MPDTWRTAAACRDLDSNVFFAEEWNKAHTATAKRICKACPVREPCLAYAMASDVRYGVWGGLTKSERKRRRKRVA